MIWPTFLSVFLLFEILLNKRFLKSMKLFEWKLIAGAEFFHSATSAFSLQVKKSSMNLKQLSMNVSNLTQYDRKLVTMDAIILPSSWKTSSISSSYSSKTYILKIENNFNSESAIVLTIVRKTIKLYCLPNNRCFT